MLAKPECKRIHPHFTGTLPFPAAGIIPDPGNLCQTGRQMAECITGNDHSIPGRFTDRLIQIHNDFRIRPAAVCKTPLQSAFHPPDRPLFHIHPPDLKHIPGGEIVLDQLKTPAGKTADVRFDIFQNFRYGGIQRPVPRNKPFRQPPGFRDLRVAVEQRPEPQPRPHAGLPHFRRQFRHIREAVIPRFPRARRSGIVQIQLPPVINHHKGAVCQTFAQCSHPAAVHQNIFVRTDAVCVIPVIPAVHRLSRKNRVRTHLFAQFPCGGKGGNPGIFPGNHFRGIHRPAIQDHPLIPATQIQPERDPFAVRTPESQCTAADLHPEPGRHIPAVHQEIPRHQPESIKTPPLQIAVSPFPCIPDKEGILRKLPMPAQTDKVHRSFSGSHTHVHSASGLQKVNPYIILQNHIFRRKNTLFLCGKKRHLLRHIQ